MNLELHQTLQHAVDKGIEAYVTSRRARIPMFIDQHFSFRGALALHRKTFGRDVYKHPVNLVWGVPVALVTGTADLLEVVFQKWRWTEIAWHTGPGLVSVQPQGEAHDLRHRPLSPL